MSSSNSSESRRPSKPQNPGAPPAEQDHLPCPRCDSTNTKFCYYNNYNFSQPRHFCKSCRRYWTQGGTLRDILVGSGSRKNAKRSRTVSTATSAQDHPLLATPVLLPIPATQGAAVQFRAGVNDELKPCGGSFTSLLNTNQGPGFRGLRGFVMGRAGWAFPGMPDGANIAGGVGNSWQFESGGEGGLIGGDCFSWSGLAISTTGNGLK